MALWNEWLMENWSQELTVKTMVIRSRPTTCKWKQDFVINAQEKEKETHQ